MSKIKILFVDHAPFIGGAQLCLARHIQYLSRKKFEPFLLTAKDSDCLELFSKSKVEICQIDFGQLKRFSSKSIVNLYQSLTGYKKNLHQVNPDIVVANTTRSLILALLSKNNHRLISYVRDYDYPKWLITLAKKKVDKFLMVSGSIKHYYANPANSELVFLGSDLHKKLSLIKSAQVKRLRKRLGLADDDVAVGFVGRLVDWKGIDVLIQAFSKIHQPNVKLVIFGSGQNQAGSIDKNLKANRQVRLAGFINNQALIFRSIDIFVLPSKKAEPFSTALIEAAMAALPIIATKTGGTEEFIRHGINGLLIPPNDAGKLHEALVRLIDDRQFADKIGAQSRKDTEMFTEEKLTEKLEKIYLNI